MSSIMITNNPKQPYLFSISMDATKKRIKIHAKHKIDSNKQYISQFDAIFLKNIGFYHSIKGFYTRLKMAFESQSPGELTAKYKLTNNALQITLEERSKFDDDSQKYTFLLKAALKSADAPLTNGNDKIDFVVAQVKEKFQTERLQRLQLEERVVALENLCSKLTKKLIKVTNDLKKEKAQKPSSNDNLFASNEEKSESPIKAKVDFEGFEEKLNEIGNNLNVMQSKYTNELHAMNQKMNDIRPKLVRLKTRKDFVSEQSFVDYMCNKLELWDANKFGPILVRVKPNASGKAKHFIGYVGEPVKWNHSIVKIRWFGLGKKQPEAVEWKALDVFLPLSAFYYPDHYRGNNLKNATTKQNIL